VLCGNGIKGAACAVAEAAATSNTASRCNDRSASKTEILLAPIAVALIIGLAIAGVVWYRKKEVRYDRLIIIEFPSTAAGVS
jgi:hypothetical protein